MDVFLKLPYEILIPDTLFEEESLKFTEAQKRRMLRGGLKVIDLPGARVLRAQQVMAGVPQLSVHDGLAFALAEARQGCILLTGDVHLQNLAATHKIEVQGFLWVVDELYKHRVGAAKILGAALRTLSQDPAVRFPRRDLAAYIKRLENLR